MFIVVWSFWMVLLGVVLGAYLHPLHGATVGISIGCVAMIAVREPVDGFIRCSLSAF